MVEILLAGLLSGDVSCCTHGSSTEQSTHEPWIMRREKTTSGQSGLLKSPATRLPYDNNSVEEPRHRRLSMSKFNSKGVGRVGCLHSRDSLLSTVDVMFSTLDY